MARLKIQRGFSGQILTTRTLQQRVNLEVLGRVADFKGATSMAGLAVRSAAGLLAHTLGWGFSGRSVEGGRELLRLFCAAASRNRRTWA